MHDPLRFQNAGRTTGWAGSRYCRDLLFGLIAWVLTTGFVAPTSLPAAEPPDVTLNPETATLAVLAASPQPFPARVPAPSIDGGKEWLNTGGEITLKDLRGKIVILDFWTYCCINCMHVLPDLKYLEKKYGRELVVIGVHSAKFENEKESAHIRRAIVRYEIEHPVINDAEMTLWQKYGVRFWPTVVVIDPEGFVCSVIPGEGRRAVLEKIIDRILAHHRVRGTLDRTPVHFDLERKKLPPTPLRFPGKVLADAEGRRLFVSDSNHNRIVISSLDGKLLDVIGSGAIGRKNGNYAEASFDHPQGLALAGNKLYVTDTENHLIREVDLATKRVRTIAGTGRRAEQNGRGGSGPQTDLNSPWDVVVVQDSLYVAMAGPHQIWKINLKSGKSLPYAGNGDEDSVDGPLENCSLAQPSGITTDGQSLYVVDSEGSSVRRIPLDPQQEQVTTLVGTSHLSVNRLFTFGDRDGVGDEVRLQHPLGIAYHEGKLFLADSYNHKIKTLDPRKKIVATLLGDRQSGDRLDPPRFFEPGGLAIAHDSLFIADTNNHRLVRVDLKSLKAELFIIAGLTPPAPALDVSEESVGGKFIAVPRQSVAPDQPLKLDFVLRTPSGFKLNRQFPVSCRASTKKPDWIDPAWLNKRHRLALPDEINQGEAGDTVTATIPLVARPLIAPTGENDLQVAITYGYCRDGEGGLCKLQTATWVVPIQWVNNSKSGAIRLITPVPAEVSKSPE